MILLGGGNLKEKFWISKWYDKKRRKGNQSKIETYLVGCWGGFVVMTKSQLGRFYESDLFYLN